MNNHVCASSTKLNNSAIKSKSLTESGLQFLVGPHAHRHRTCAVDGSNRITGNRRLCRRRRIHPKGRTFLVVALSLSKLHLAFGAKDLCTLHCSKEAGTSIYILSVVAAVRQRRNPH